MSIAGIGGLGAGSASQMLSVLLSRLDQQSSSTMEADDTPAASPAPSGCSPPAIAGNAKPSLSSMVLGALIGAQAQSSDNSSPANSTTAQDPVQSLFSAMDGDGDGTVSQTEMETYIQSKGGTQGEADTLYGMLTQNGTTALIEQQLAAQAPQPPSGPDGVQGRHHHGHHHHASSADAADALMQALDADANGAVDQSELEGFVTKNGGTANQADAIFASLDSKNVGAIGSADFASASEQMQSNSSSGSNSPVMLMLNALANRNASDTGTISVSA